MIVGQSADETEKRIIECLQQNPRATNREVAESLDLAEPTVANRIRRMAENSDMRVVAQKHVFSDGYTTMYTLFINTSSGPVQKIARAIAKNDDVLAVSQGIGNPDIVVTARAKTNKDIHALTKRIAGLRGIASIESVLSCAIHKYIANSGDLKATNSGLEVSDEDNLEERILSVLSKDARQSNREVGRQVGVTETAIRHRLNKLLKKGELQFEVVCHHAFAGMNVMAIARVFTEPRRTDEVIQSLVGFDNVGFVAETTGHHNILIYMYANSNEELGNFCDNVLQTLRGLERLDVHLYVSVVKHQINLAYFEPKAFIPKRK